MPANTAAKLPITHPIHPKALEGIQLFNAGEYWHAHEALEIAWLAEPGEIRNLYRGILQAGVAYLHIQRGNYRGAIKVALRAEGWLRSFPDICLGIDVARLRTDLQAALVEVRRL